MAASMEEERVCDDAMFKSYYEIGAMSACEVKKRERRSSKVVKKVVGKKRAFK